MSKYHHVLVALDLTPGSEQLLKVGQQIVASNLSIEAAKLSVVHVVEHAAAAYGGEFSIPVDVNLEQQVEVAVRARMQKLAEKYAIPDSRVCIRNGSVKRDVIASAEELHADLILVGLRAQSGVERLLGSTANGILHLSACDVLSVHLS